MNTNNQLSYSTENKKRSYHNGSSNKDNSICECCGVCFLLLLGLGIIGGAIAYIVFGIMYLVQDYDIANSCEGSSLWAYVLTAIILSISRSGAKNSNDEDLGIGGKICLLVCLGLIECGLAIWGGMELWVNSCDDLRDSNLWKFGLATFILQVICASAFLVIMPLTFTCLICVENNKKQQDISHV